MKLIFWNVHNTEKSFSLLEQKLYSDSEIGGIIFSEFWNIPSAVDCSTKSDNAFWAETTLNNRVGCIFRKTLKPKVHRSSDYYNVIGIEYNSKQYTLVMCHFLSQSESELDAKAFSQLTISEIKAIIRDKHLINEIFIGDFNLPHTSDVFVEIGGLNSTNYLHNRIVKKTKARKIPIFYSPISGFHGDRSTGPAGTYYKTTGRQAQSWLVYDNFFINNAIANDLEIDGCAILCSINGAQLYIGKKINQEFSDHLPIQLALK